MWGCLNHCPYCYARGIAKRFGGVRAEQEYYSHYWGNKRCAKGVNKTYIKNLGKDLRDFKLTFLYGQYFSIFPKKPQRIFVGSMSEIYYWENDWMEKVLYRIKEYPQHTFQFLTKYPEVYSRYIFPKNCWLGITITHAQEAYQPLHIAPENKDHIFFVCTEPMLDYIPIDLIDYADWIILGAETGNRKGKVIPKKAWILTMIEQLRHRNIPIYIKDSILKLYPEVIDAYPSFHLYPEKDRYQWFRRTRIDWTKRKIIKGAKK